jgi:ketosteroid isomerase-like protein
MKRTNVLSVSMLFAIMFMAGTAYSQTNSGDQAKVKELTQQFAQCMREGNMEKLYSLYTADAISLPSYQPMLEGIAAIKAAGMTNHGEKYNSFELSTVKLIANGTMINEIGTYKLNVSVPNMDKPIDDHGKYLTIWEKQKDGSVKIKIITWNSDVDPMMMTGQMGQKDAGK